MLDAGRTFKIKVRLRWTVWKFWKFWKRWEFSLRQQLIAFKEFYMYTRLSKAILGHSIEVDQGHSRNLL